LPPREETDEDYLQDFEQSEAYESISLSNNPASDFSA
jgi:hypothetical protein